MHLPEEYQKLDSQDQSVLLDSLQRRQYQSDECIFKAGDVGDYALFIESGDVRLEFEEHQLDCESVVATMCAGDIVGELSLLDEEVRSLSAYAENDVEARLLSRQVLEQLKQTNPKFAASIFQALGKSASVKLRKANAKVEESLVMQHGHLSEVDDMVTRASDAQAAFIGWSEAQIDELLFRMCQVILENSPTLAEQAVKETRLGNAKDKQQKHVSACLGVYGDIVSKIGSGVAKKYIHKGVTEIYDAMGVIFGLIPMTNPVSTTVFKALISVKSRNSIILSPNRMGSVVVVKVVDMLREVLAEHGAPVDLIQVVKERQSRQITSAFMRHSGISLVLATGGASMVKAAYSSGTPTIGVGPGNTPCMIADDANLKHAATSIIRSKAFDNGIICGSEHNLVVSKSNHSSLCASLQSHGAAVLNADETELFKQKAFTPKGHLNRRIIGQDAVKIAEYVGIKRDYLIKLIVVPAEGVHGDNPLAKEKTAPIVSLFTVVDDQQAINMCASILEIDGAGHTAVIHTRNRKLARQFANTIKASRILVNSPGLQGITGGCTGLTPSFTLGCGSYGGTSTTDNVSFSHLVNTKRMAYYLPYKKLDVLTEKMHHFSPKALYAIRLFGKLKRGIKLFSTT